LIGFDAGGAAFFFSAVGFYQRSLRRVNFFRFCEFVLLFKKNIQKFLQLLQHFNGLLIQNFTVLIENSTILIIIKIRKKPMSDILSTAVCSFGINGGYAFINGVLNLQCPVRPF
jgi:hypothetical protein